MVDFIIIVYQSLFFLLNIRPSTPNKNMSSHKWPDPHTRLWEFPEFIFWMLPHICTSSAQACSPNEGQMLKGRGDDRNCVCPPFWNGHVWLIQYKCISPSLNSQPVRWKCQLPNSESSWEDKTSLDTRKCLVSVVTIVTISSLALFPYWYFTNVDQKVRASPRKVGVECLLPIYQMMGSGLERWKGYAQLRCAVFTIQLGLL